MSTLALPATGEALALRSPMAGMSAASPCSSPSTIKPGRFAFAAAVAAHYLVDVGMLGAALVENDSMATRGVSPVRLA